MSRFSSARRYEALCAEPITEPRTITAAQRAALDQVAAALGCTPAQISARTRGREAVERRQAAIWLLRERRLSLPAIGRLVERDVATVIYNLRVVEQRRCSDGAFARQLDQLHTARPVAAD